MANWSRTWRTANWCELVSNWRTGELANWRTGRRTGETVSLTRSTGDSREGCSRLCLLGGELVGELGETGRELVSLTRSTGDSREGCSRLCLLGGIPPIINAKTDFRPHPMTISAVLHHPPPRLAPLNPALSPLRSPSFALQPRLLPRFPIRNCGFRQHSRPICGLHSNRQSASRLCRVRESQLPAPRSLNSTCASSLLPASRRLRAEPRTVADSP